jgi:hypothetical protein
MTTGSQKKITTKEKLHFTIKRKGLKMLKIINFINNQTQNLKLLISLLEHRERRRQKMDYDLKHFKQGGTKL